MRDRNKDPRISRQAAAFERLHQGLIGDRSLAGTPYLDEPDLLAAYQAHFSPQSYAKAYEVLREVVVEPSLVRRVFDFASGPGGMAAASKALFPSAEIIACDRSEAALALVPPGIQRVVWDLTLSPPQELGRADIVILGNALSELQTNEAAFLSFLLETFVSRDSGMGMLVVIEPALRETARTLELARNSLIGDMGYFVVAPCLYRGGCPALARERDWCHEDRVGVGGIRIKYSYLVLTRRGEWSQDEGLYRIVSDRFSEKGRQHYFGCGPAGRHKLVRLRRHRSEQNHAFSSLERGGIVRLEGLERRGDEMRLLASTSVTSVSAK